MNRIILIYFTLLLYSCGISYDSEQVVSQKPLICPDYDLVEIPRNIAPLNFQLKDDAEYIIVTFADKEGEELFKTKGKGNEVSIPINKWKKTLLDTSLKELKITVNSIKNKIKYTYEPFTIFVNNDNIDTHLAYRLIEPGYEQWGKMGIYQRDLTSFDQKAIIENSFTNDGCINCHAFSSHSPDNMMFHLRKNYDGTVIYKDGEATILETKTGSMIGSAVYPSWHPKGRYIAYSTNITRQMFHNTGEKPIEVFDLDSDIVIYDTETNRMFTSDILYDKELMETFPSWSNDGKYLYFTAAPKPKEAEPNIIDIKYNLYRVEFDQETEKFKNKELLYDAISLDKSVSFPQSYNDDKKVSFILSDYGNFSIWHKESDIYGLDLNSREVENIKILNSNNTESFHSYSSNGNWIVFSSRRDDGLYTRPYIAYYDKKNDKFSKPFMLPQESASYYFLSEKSFNIPRFITGEVTGIKEMKRAIKSTKEPIKRGEKL